MKFAGAPGLKDRNKSRDRVGWSWVNQPRYVNEQGDDGQPASTNGQGDEQFDLRDDVANLFQVGLGAGAPGFDGRHLFFQDQDIVTGGYVFRGSPGSSTKHGVRGTGGFRVWHGFSFGTARLPVIKQAHG